MDSTYLAMQAGTGLLLDLNVGVVRVGVHVELGLDGGHHVDHLVLRIWIIGGGISWIIMTWQDGGRQSWSRLLEGFHSSDETGQKVISVTEVMGKLSEAVMRTSDCSRPSLTGGQFDFGNEQTIFH